MHRLLEEHLDQIAARLGPLPVARRNDEIKEVRQHLLNAVIVNREMGLTEDEAAATAVEQCGAPEEAAQGLVWAWRRGETMRRRGFWGAAVCTLVLLLLAELLGPYDPLTNQLIVLGLNGPSGGNHMGPEDVAVIVQYALVGGVSGLIFFRRTLSGIVLGAVGWLGFSSLIVSLASFSGESILKLVMSALTAVLAAWAGNRWQNARMDRARRARG